MTSAYKTSVFPQSQIATWIPYIAESRIKEFRHYPYLYDGSLEYEKAYLAEYAADPESILVVAQLCDATPIGFVTGLPLKSESAILETIPEEYKTGDLYYFGEFIVDSKYRGLGVAKSLQNAGERQAKLMGYKGFSILTVERDILDPRRPSGYRDSDQVWERLGYVKKPITIDFSWLTFMDGCTSEDTLNPMRLWIK